MAIENRALAPRCFYEQLLFNKPLSARSGEHLHLWYTTSIGFFTNADPWYKRGYEIWANSPYRLMGGSEGFMKPAGVLIERKLTELWPRNNVLP